MTVDQVAVAAAAVIASYFLGNISPAILLGRMSGVDIRKEGSGNAGTTNVLRVLGKKAAAATLAIDVLKGVAAVLLGRYLCGQDVAMMCGVAAFCGHIWPAAFRFKGGKGVATALGVIVATAPVLGAGILAVALAIIAATKRVSAGAVCAALIFPAAAAIYDRSLLAWSAVLAVIVLVKHRQNIGRLLAGVEPKISFKK
ncbi:MAG: glycerol-3-phosphate 1-O-acyltransferase PlsY [Clostridiales bacterium]|nr:glycerol-3-phosphate 1-O-acyltransferase PlsY [Clostridiales bacterium]